MKTKLQVVIAIGVAVLMQMNTVAYADQSYSAVAEVDSTSGWAYGSAVGYSSRHNADVSALNGCHSLGKGQCHVVSQFRGARCVALARGSDGAGGWGAVSGYSNNRSVARNRAMNECNSRGYGCHITATDCTEN